MKITALAAVALAGLILAACAPRYYDEDGYYRHSDSRAGYGDRYYGERYPGGGGMYYTDRNRYNDSYYQNPSREDRYYGNRYDRDDD